MIGYKKRLSPGTSPWEEPLLYKGGDALESKSGRFFRVVNGLALLSSLSKARGWCWRIKGGSEVALAAPKMAQKKAQYPYIGHCAVKKVRLSLYQVERFCH